MTNFKKNILAIIPARGGSKRVPRKNIVKIGGKPMIQYSIEAGLKSKYINKTIVSTDDPEIIKISSKLKAEVMKRPKAISGDFASTNDALKHAVDYLAQKENYVADIIVVLQPTSPLRNVEDLDNAIELFLKNKCKSVISVFEPENTPFWNFEIRNKYLKPLFDWKYFTTRSQDLPKTYTVNGAIYITSKKEFYKSNSFFNEKIIPSVMPRERSVDIDYPIDLAVAELMLKNK